MCINEAETQKAATNQIPSSTRSMAIEVRVSDKGISPQMASR